MAPVNRAQRMKRSLPPNNRTSDDKKMKTQDYQISITVDTTPQEVFKNINDVPKWWTDDFKGSSHKLHDEFSVHFEGFHDSTQRLVEVVPNKKVVWLVTDSALTFIKDQQEWTNTKISFEL